MALRFHETCDGVAAVCRQRVWNETAVKQQNKLHGQKLINLICIPSVLTCLNCLPSSVGVCVAQSRYGIGYGVEDRGIFSIPGYLLCSNPKPPNVIQGRPNILFNGHQVLFRLGGIYKEHHPLLWVTSRASRGKFEVRCIPNNTNYCANFYFKYATDNFE